MFAETLYRRAFPAFLLKCCIGGVFEGIYNSAELTKHLFFCFAQLVNNFHHRTKGDEAVAPLIQSFLTHNPGMFPDVTLVI